MYFAIFALIMELYCNVIFIFSISISCCLCNFSHNVVHFGFCMPNSVSVHIFFSIFVKILVHYNTVFALYF